MPSILMSAAFVFAIGAVFWAGATYQRIGNIEVRLRHIDEQLGKITDMPVLIERTSDHHRRLEALEKLMLERPA